MNEYVYAACEGMLDEAVINKLFKKILPHTVAHVITCGGKANLDKRLRDYNKAAKNIPWFVLRDMDHDAKCAASLVERKLPNPAHLMVFRIAVREVEVWLMADRKKFASYMGVNESLVPIDPENEPDPKQKAINIARKSKKRFIKEYMIPDEGEGIGKNYDSCLMEFVHKHWNPIGASTNSDSLTRCIFRLRAIAPPPRPS